jgi:hypothetical protein
MANYTLSEAYSFVGTKNLQFERNWERWQFLLESYMGGEEYRRGAHLTRYTLETQGEYSARLRNTPLDNQCKSVISVYNSFLFREPATRDLASIQDDLTDDFLRDADLDGRSFNAFMKDVSTWASVFGHCFVIMTKPSVEAQTLADQRAAGIRPYVNLLTPLVVTDWKWSRRPNGRYDMTYVKYIEDVNDSVTTIREWTPELIRTWEVDDHKREAMMIEEQVNELGRVPIVLVYNQRSQVRGIGISDISDIADMQRAIYNELSEVEQSVRLEGHPSLVATPDTQIGAGAGALILMNESLDPGLKPYVLDIDAAPISTIYESIRNRTEAIDRMANTGGVRAVESRVMSGVALETEFQLLNARLSEKAANMELAEEQIWEMYCVYEDKQWMGSIDYPGSFNIRDTGREYDQLHKASQTTQDPDVMQLINERLVELLGEDPEDVFVVDTGLPDAYVPADTPGVPANQNCENCRFYDDITANCSKWDQQVSPVYWCRAWDGRNSQA